MRELDLVLLPFVERHFPGLDTSAQREYTRLLEQEDQDLYRWLIGSNRPEDTGLAAIVATILASSIQEGESPT